MAASLLHLLRLTSAVRSSDCHTVYFDPYLHSVTLPPLVETPVTACCALFLCCILTDHCLAEVNAQCADLFILLSEGFATVYRPCRVDRGKGEPASPVHECIRHRECLRYSVKSWVVRNRPSQIRPSAWLWSRNLAHLAGSRPFLQVAQRHQKV